VFNFETHTVLLKGITWTRESHGLFDYESRHLIKKTMRTNAAIGVLRSENDITAHPYTDTIAIDDQLNVWRASKQITDVKPLLKVIN